MLDVCKRCGRKLSSHRSMKLGYGEECWRKMRAVAASIRNEHERGLIGAFTDRQIDSAVELITDGAIVHIGDDIFVAVSTDGAEQYCCTIFECTCPAGERDLNCYHQAAALVLQGVS